MKACLLVPKKLSRFFLFQPLSTHSFPMHPFSIPWKHQKTLRFSMFSDGRERCIGNEWVEPMSNLFMDFFLFCSCRRTAIKHWIKKECWSWLGKIEKIIFGNIFFPKCYIVLECYMFSNAIASAFCHKFWVLYLWGNSGINGAIKSIQ